MRNRNTQGFTLIELLIVIAIIGILAAVLIPNLLNARSRAFDTAAQTCLRELATTAEVERSDAPFEYPSDGATAAANNPGALAAADVTAVNSCGSIYLVLDQDTPTEFIYQGAHIDGRSVYEISDGTGVERIADIAADLSGDPADVFTGVNLVEGTAAGTF